MRTLLVLAFLAMVAAPVFGKTVVVPPGRFLVVEAEQQGTDVRIILTRGKTRLVVDRPMGRVGPEVAVVGPGTWTVEAEPSERANLPPRYVLRTRLASTRPTMAAAADAFARADVLLDPGRPQDLRAARTLVETHLSERDPFWRTQLLLLLSTIRQSQGDVPKALALAETALRQREQAFGVTDPRLVPALRVLGKRLRQSGRASEGEAALRRAASLAEKAHGRDHPQYAESLLDLAIAINDDRRDALPAARDALQAAERAWPADAEALRPYLHSVVHLLTSRAEYAEAENLLKRSLALPGATGATRANILERLGRVQMSSGRFDEGLATWREALALRDRHQPRHPDIAFSRVQLSARLRQAARLDEALRLVREALIVLEAYHGRSHPRYADALVELALVLEARAEPSEAVAVHQQALTIYEKACGERHPDTAGALGNLGHLYTRLGNHARAEAALKRALAIEEALHGRDHPGVVHSLSALGVLYENQGKHALSIDAHRRALAILEKARPDDVLAIADSCNNLGVVLMWTGALDEAEALLERGLGILESRIGRSTRRAASLHNNLAFIRGKRGDSEGEMRQLLTSLAILEDLLGPSHPQLAGVLENLGAAHIRSGDIPSATRVMARGNDLRDRELSNVLLSGSEDDKRAFLELLRGETDATVSLHVRLAPRDADAIRLALTTVLRRKARSLDAMAASLAILRQRTHADHRALLDRYAATRSLLAKLQLAEHPDTTAIAKAEEEVKRLEDEVSRRSARFRLSTEAVTIERVQARIPADAALVEIISYAPWEATATGGRFLPHDAYAAYILRSDGAADFVDLGPAAPIDTAVTALRRALSRHRSKDWRERARELDRLVMAPIRPHLGKARRLLISPDGALNLVPFGALLDEEGRCLLDRYSPTYLTVGSDLLGIGEVREGHRLDALIVGAPAYGGETASSTDTRGVAPGRTFAPLPGTEAEAHVLRALLPGSRVVTGRDATEAMLREAQAPPLLHLGTHGWFLPPAPKVSPLLRSGLALAGANARQDGAGGDGLLTALEASALNLEGTRLVTLSACETGVGDIALGDGVHGLRRAFVLAGSEAQLMTLWKVSDDATRDLMVSLYERLAKGDERGEALRRVQLAMMREPGREHPFYWAPFILSGDWRADRPGAPHWRFPPEAWWPAPPSEREWVAARVFAMGGARRVLLGSDTGVVAGAPVREPGGEVVGRVTRVEDVASEIDVGDGWVEVEVARKPRLEQSVLWPVARSGAEIVATMDPDRTLLSVPVAWDAVPARVEEVVEDMLADLHAASAHAPTPELEQALAAAKREDVLSFLRHMAENADRYERKTWRLAEVYAGWLRR